MRDFASTSHPIPCIPPTIKTGAAAINGSAVDLRDADAATFIIQLGNITSTTFTATPKIQISDDGSTGWKDYPNANGAIYTRNLENATFGPKSGNTTRKIWFVDDTVRYVRLVLTFTGNASGNIPLSAVAVLGQVRVAPTPSIPQADST